MKEKTIKKTLSFIQPKRRLTRQKSGFKVSGTKTGSECLIFPTDKYIVKKKILKIEHSDFNVKFDNLFSESIFIYGFGFYIKSNKELLISGSIKIKGISDGPVISEQVNPNTWTRIGFDMDSDSLLKNKKYKIDISVILMSENSNFEIEVFGFQSGPVNHYVDKKLYKNNFYEKTDLYKPEIYYLPYKKILIKDAKYIGNGFIVGKSCNRCARFLPIDIEKELNPLGFSNHCKKRAPCKHNAFSRYIIENQEAVNNLPKNIQDKIIDIAGQKYLINHYGFQLECRSCKKFEVNAPLNPLRNKAQHHEDGSRRRALEKMIIELTGEDVVKNYRLINGREFQDNIWLKFNKKCFACGDPLPKISNMDIDHTLPLVYLWPLDETATCLCKKCNSRKHDLFPAEFYSNSKLLKLSKITNIPFKVIKNKERRVNPVVLKLLLKKVVWLFDEFLARSEYQKIKKGKKVSDLIYKALQKVLLSEDVNLIELYFKEIGKYPKTITLN